jgi:hypothetical protein
LHAALARALRRSHLCEKECCAVAVRIAMAHDCAACLPTALPAVDPSHRTHATVVLNNVTLSCRVSLPQVWFPKKIEENSEFERDFLEA